MLARIVVQVTEDFTGKCAVSAALKERFTHKVLLLENPNHVDVTGVTRAKNV